MARTKINAIVSPSPKIPYPKQNRCQQGKQYCCFYLVGYGHIISPIKNHVNVSFCCAEGFFF